MHFMLIIHFRPWTTSLHTPYIMRSNAIRFQYNNHIILFYRLRMQTVVLSRSAIAMCSRSDDLRQYHFGHSIFMCFFFARVLS